MKKIFILLILIWASQVFARKDFNSRPVVTNFNPPGPSRSWLGLSNDKKLVYIHWPKEYKFTIREYPAFPEDEFTSKNYPRSGLYLIKGRQFLWDISNPFPEMVGVRPLNNQQYLIAFGPKGTENFDELAFAIYNKGELVKKFQIKDFCTSNRYMRSEMSKFSSFFSWYNDFKLDELNIKFTFEACNNLYTVNLSDGKFSKEHLFPKFNAYKNELKIVSFTLLLISPVLFLFILFLEIKKKGSFKQKIFLVLFLLLSISAYPLFLRAERSNKDPFVRIMEESSSRDRNPFLNPNNQTDEE